VNRRLAAGIGAVVAGALVAGLIGVRVASSDDERAAPRASTTTSTSTSTSTTSTTAATSPEVDAVVIEVEAFVVATRGLAFKRPVAVTLLDGEAFRSRLLADAEESRDEIELSQRALRAIRLLEPGVDLYEALLRLYGDAVVGFYDPEKGDLVVRGSGSLGPYARSVLAHELTHALDDQWFELDRPALDEPGRGEEASAFAALVEGNAERVQQAYLAQLGAADRRRAAEEERRAAGSVDPRDVPEVLFSIISWPYVAGPPFVRALLRDGGERRVDAAFADPPTTTAQIAEPERYLAGDDAVPVPEPAADGRVLERGIYGHASLIETLEPVVGAGDAEQAADGWAGDAYVLWDAGQGRSCVRAFFVMRTPADLAELDGALAEWAAERGAAVTRRDGRIELTTCG
jgi:hypothetical protein